VSAPTYCRRWCSRRFFMILYFRHGAPSGSFTFAPYCSQLSLLASDPQRSPSPLRFVQRARRLWRIEEFAFPWNSIKQLIIQKVVDVISPLRSPHARPFGWSYSKFTVSETPRVSKRPSTSLSPRSQVRLVYSGSILVTMKSFTYQEVHCKMPVQFPWDKRPVHSEIDNWNGRLHVNLHEAVIQMFIPLPTS
jgi:hypothetical protein